MRHRLEFALLGLLFTLVSGCRSGPPPLVAGGEIRNLLPGTALDVRAVHDPTRMTAATNEILPGRVFLLSFPTRQLLSTSVLLSWKTTSGQTWSRELDIPAPPDAIKDDVLWVVYSLRPGGEATVEFELASRASMGL